MEQHSIRLAKLLAKYINHTISSNEKEELTTAIPEKDLQQILLDVQEKRGEQEELLLYFESKKGQAWKKIKPTNRLPFIRKIYHKYVAAAIILLIATLSWYVLRVKMPDTVYYNSVMPDKLYGQKNDVSPGKEQTLIEFANGEKVVVQDRILKIGDEDILGAVDMGNFFVQPMENIKTIITPKASNIEVWLPDNTKVWLNASSTLTLDRGYNTNNRIVHLEGEGFFEVSKDAKRQFMVVSNRDTVAVYGTAFNVNSYGHRMETTLLEGKVRLQGSAGKKLDLPVGYQARWQRDGWYSRKVEVQKYVSWKEGYFYFKQDRLSEVIQKMADWYAIEIQSEIDREKILISGTIDKSATLAEAVSILQDVSGLKFEINNRTLKITK